MLQRGKHESLVISGAIFLLLGILSAPTAQAFDVEAYRAARAADRTEYESRIAELRARLHGDANESSETSTTESNSGSEFTAASHLNDEEETPTCTCSSSVKFSKPELRWSDNMLQFVPRFDVSIRVRGEEGAPDWQSHLNWDGVANTTVFSGHQEFGGQCFDSRFRYTGLAGAPVTMTDIVRSAFPIDAEDFDTNVKMRATITGCDTDEETRQAKVTVEELGNLKVRGWRIWRP